MKKIILIITAAVLIWACNKPVDTDETHAHDTSTIALNEGAKWKVVDDMLQIIRMMETDIVNHSESDGSFDKLEVSLNHNLDSLTSNCTMSGKAHDELHKWLLPYIDLVGEFSESTEDAERREHLTELRESYETFNQYFD